MHIIFLWLLTVSLCCFSGCLFLFPWNFLRISHLAHIVSAKFLFSSTLSATGVNNVMEIWWGQIVLGQRWRWEWFDVKFKYSFGLQRRWWKLRLRNWTVSFLPIWTDIAWDGKYRALSCRTVPAHSRSDYKYTRPYCLKRVRWQVFWVSLASSWFTFSFLLLLRISWERKKSKRKQLQSGTMSSLSTFCAVLLYCRLTSRHHIPKRGLLAVLH